MSRASSSAPPSWLELDAGLVSSSFSRWGSARPLWLYFSDEGPVEHAMQTTPSERRPRVALTAFGYWHYGLLLGVVAVAAGLKKAVGDHTTRSTR